MASFVIRGAAAILFRDHHVSCCAELDLLQRVGQISLKHDILFAARGEQCGLVHEVRQVGSRHARRRRCDLFEIDTVCERNLSRVDPKDLDAALSGRADAP